MSMRLRPLSVRTSITRLAMWAALLLAAGCNAAPVSGAGSPATAQPATVDQLDFQKGIVFATWWHGGYATPQADRALADLAATGANWLAIVVTGYQETYVSTAIRRDLPRTPTDADLAHVIDKAHELGLRVMLKPHLDLSDDPARWRANIGSAFEGETQWRQWFASYRRFIEHYAVLAHDHGVEQFCVGTELAGTTHREKQWREVIRGVREIFPGPITYASNHSGEETAIGWWDTLDYIGVDDYYPLSTAPEPTAEELRGAWTAGGYIETLRRLAERHAKPILLTEIGYRSVEGAVAAPWDSGRQARIDLKEQATAYRAAFQALWNQPWLAGIYWWNWDTDPSKGGDDDGDYTPRRKPAEAVLRAFYLGRSWSPRAATATKRSAAAGRREISLIPM
jgi:hypothetical protein